MARKLLILTSREPIPDRLLAESERSEAVTLMLKAGVDPNEPVYGGRTPLHVAADAGQPKSITALLEAGAELEARDENGDTHCLWQRGQGRRKPSRHCWRRE